VTTTPAEAAEFFRTHARAPEQPTREAQRMLDILCDHAQLVPNAASVDRYGVLCAAQSLRALAQAHEPPQGTTGALPAALAEVYREGAAEVTRDAHERARALDHQTSGGT
jgi:hypothetical protein